MRGFSDSQGDRIERAQECPAHAAWSRADCTAGCERADAGGRRRSGRRLPADSSQVGRSLSLRRIGGIAGSLIPAPPAASANSSSGCRSDRKAAPPALDRQADRRRDRRITSDRQPGSASAAQVRSQGYACDEPVTAKRGVRLSKPDLAVWVLNCRNATYRVRLHPDMAAHVIKLKHYH